MSTVNASAGSRPSGEINAFLATGPRLSELREAFPAEWIAVRAELERVVESGSPQELEKLARAAGQARASRTFRDEAAATRYRIRQHMTAAAIRDIALGAATGATQSTIRLDGLSARILQRLLFERDLERRAFSMRTFARVWPRIPQRARLMPLVQPRGIYCFYSREFVRAIAEIVDRRPCLEVAAGDGTLTRLLQHDGVAVVATDDHSWSHAITFPSCVARLDAREALAQHEPAVVICSWPPANNRFERHVLAASSVETYVAIGSQHAYASGARSVYDAPTHFGFSRDDRPDLAQLIAPLELNSQVLVFNRAR